MPEVADPVFARFADALLAVHLDPPDDAEARGVLETLRADLHAPSDPGDSFAALCANVGLDRPAREVLAVVLACETDLARAARLGPLSGGPLPGRLTLGGAARLLGSMQACVDAVGAGSALRRSALVDVVAGPGPWATHVVALAPSLAWAIGGDLEPDPDLPPGTWTMPGGPRSAGADETPDEVERSRLLLVAGADPVRRRAAVARASTAESHLIATMPDDDAGWAALVREASITGSGVLVEVGDELPAVGRSWIERATHLSWALCSRDELALDVLPRRARRELLAPDHVVTAEEWALAIGVDTTPTHRLQAQQLESVAEVLPAVDGDIDRAVRRLLAGPLGRLARRIRPAKTWDDIVLDDAKLAQLRAVVTRFRHAGTVYDDWEVTTASGRGIVSMFTGPSGTGKSLAAEVVAHELGLDLYKVDLSSVVSKYIGETEQNLEKLFAAASAGSAVLFFDEADSIFGKRSEVKDGRDRYANLEVSYLLQRLEHYDGVVVLATNLPKNIDDAFVRRIHEIVSFTLPAADERRAIWQRHLGDGRIPLGPVDVDLLADRFEVSGGNIRNVVIASAFAAADEGVPLSTAHLLAAMMAEYGKLNRMFRMEEFLLPS